MSWEMASSGVDAMEDHRKAQIQERYFLLNPVASRGLTVKTCIQGLAKCTIEGSGPARGQSVYVCKARTLLFVKK